MKIEEYVEEEYKGAGLNGALANNITTTGDFFGKLAYILIVVPIVFIFGTAFFIAIAAICIASVVGWLLIPFVLISYLEFLGALIFGVD